MNLKVAQWVNIILLTLVVGVFWGTWFSLSRSITSISPQTFLAIGKIMIANLAVPMRILIPLALVSTLPVLFLLYKERFKTAFYLTFIGLLLFIIALVITLVVNVPIDNQITHWTVSMLPPNWKTIRDTWKLYHTIRTFTSLIGLGCVLAGTFASFKKAKL